MVRVFGPAAYADMMQLPSRAIVRFAEIQGERDASRWLTRLRLMAVADGMELGQEYVRGPNDPKPKPGDGYTSRKPYLQMEETLERQAEPWAAAERQRQRRIKEQDAKWERAKAAMRGRA